MFCCCLSVKKAEIWLTSLSAGVRITAKQFRGATSCLSSNRLETPSLVFIGKLGSFQCCFGAYFNWVSLVSQQPDLRGQHAAGRISILDPL